MRIYLRGAHIAVAEHLLDRADIGTILYQSVVTLTPTVMTAMIHMDVSEVVRIIVSNGMIVYALTRKVKGGSR